jgi:hypothetical protein
LNKLKRFIKITRSNKIQNKNKLQDFLKATDSVCFFVVIGSTNVHWRDIRLRWQDICLDNDKTNERLVVKAIDPPHRDPFHFQCYPEPVLISRYPVKSQQGWIEANEQEIVKWEIDEQNRLIRFDYRLE